MLNHDVLRMWTWIVWIASIMLTNEHGWLGFSSKNKFDNLIEKIDNRKDLLFIDNCLAHPKTIKGKKNIVFLATQHNIKDLPLWCRDHTSFQDALSSLILLKSFRELWNWDPKIRWMF